PPPPAEPKKIAVAPAPPAAKAVAPAVPAPHPAAAAAPVAVAVAADEEPPRDPDPAMLQLLELVVQKKASDLHLTTAFPPCLRLDGDIVQLEGFGELSNDRLREMVFSIAPSSNRQQWLATRD